MQAIWHALLFFFHELVFANRMLLMAASAAATSQVLKFVVSSVRSRTVLSERLFESGGMPSSHSAMVTSLTTAVGLTHGWHSDLFALAAVFTAIVLYDAVNIRFAVGEHGRLFNEMLGRHGTTLAFKEQLGHTPQEVVAGAVLGVIFTTLFYR